MSPGESISDRINAALDGSNYLILLASPEAAASTWVRDELTIWCAELGRAERLIIVLTAGEIAVDESGRAIDWPRTSALPRLLENFIPGLPLWVDATRLVHAEDCRLDNPQYYAAVASIAAALEGVEPNVLIGKEWQVRRKALRAAWGAAAIFALLAAGLATLGFILNSSVHTASSRELAATSRLKVRGDRLMTASKAVGESETTEAVRALLDAHAASRSLLWETQVSGDSVESLTIYRDRILVVANSGVLDLDTRQRIRTDTRLVANTSNGPLWYAGETLASEGLPSSQLEDTPTSLSVSENMVIVSLADGRVMARTFEEAPLALLHAHDSMGAKVHTAAGWVVSTALERATPVKIWHATHGSIDLPNPPFSANAGAIAPNGKFVSVAFEDGTVGVWTLPSLRKVFQTRLDQSASSTAWRHDSAYVAFGTIAGDVIVFNEDFDMVDEIDAVIGGVWAMVWRGEDLITTGSDGVIRAWRPGETVGPVTRYPKMPTTAKVVAAALGGMPALVHLDDKLHFDFSDRVSIPVRVPEGCRLHTAEISASGKFAVLNWRPQPNQNAECSVSLWELASSEISVLPGAPKWITAIAFYGDNRLVVTGSAALGAGVHLVAWRVPSLELFYDKILSRAPIESITFHGPDTFLLGGLLGTLTLHPLHGEETQSNVPVGAVRDVLVLNDGTIVTSDVDGVRWYEENLALRGTLLDTSGSHMSVWTIHSVPEKRAIQLEAQNGDTIEVSLSLSDWLASAASKVRKPPGYIQ